MAHAFELVYIWYTGLDELEQNAVKDGVNEVLALTPRRKVMPIGEKIGPSGFSAADYVRAASRNARGQVDSGELLTLFLTDPWRKEHPHIDVVFVEDDLCPNIPSQPMNFVFGQAWEDATVQSVCRYRHLSDSDRALVIKSIAQHELGHVFGCAYDLRRPHTHEQFGPHCLNKGCVMRQTLTIEELVRNSHESQRMGMIYCPECLDDAWRSPR